MKTGRFPRPARNPVTGPIAQSPPMTSSQLDLQLPAPPATGDMPLVPARMGLNPTKVSVRSAGDDFNHSLSLRFQSLRSGCSQMFFLVRAHSCFVS